MEKFLEYNDIGRSNVSHGLGTYFILALMMLMGVYAKKWRMRATGYHKKVEEAPLTGSFSKKYRDA